MPMTDRPPPPAPSRERTKGWGFASLLLIAIGFVCYIVFGVAIALSGVAGSTNPDDIPVHLGLIAALSVISFVVGAGLLIAKVLVDRVLNREDNYYSKNIER